LQSRHYKRYGIANGEKKKWKYKVSRGKPMPWRMLEWRINVSPGAGVIYQYHQAHGGPPKNIKRIEALIQKTGLIELKLALKHITQ
jgi:hypothetical protein